MTKTKVIYIIQAFEQESEGRLTDLCQVEVYAESAEEAIKKARGYIKKTYYRVCQIIEK